MVIPLEPLWLLLLTALLLLGAMRIGYGLARWRNQRRGRARNRHGQRAELKAPAALARRGYQVVERHPKMEFTWWLDDDPVTGHAQPDWLARRGRRRYLVEVKTGRAANPKHTETRRQLHEYATCFDVDGVLLLDADNDHLYEIEFPLGVDTRGSRFRPYLAGVLTGLALAGAYLTWEALVLH